MKDLKASLYLKVVEFTGIESDLNWVEFDDGYSAGYINIVDDDGALAVAFSIPVKGGHSYIVVTDGDPKEACKEVASIQQYNDLVADLCFTHTVPTENEYMNSNGWVKYLLTRPRICFHNFPDESNVDSIDLRFFLALPLNDAEVSIKNEKGYDALLDYLSDENRDPFSVEINS